MTDFSFYVIRLVEDNMHAINYLIRTKYLLLLKYLHFMTHTIAMQLLSKLTSPINCNCQLIEINCNCNLCFHRFDRQSKNGEITYRELKKHFAQAEGTSPIITPLWKIMRDRMSGFCDQILDDTYNIPTTLPHIVQKYLKNMKRDNNIPQEHNPTIPLSEI